MRYSEDRMRHISHQIVDAIYYDDLVDYDDEEAVIRAVKKVIFDYFGEEERIDSFVKGKINSLSREVPFKSREWEILYRQYYEEEMKKKGY